VCFRPPRYYSNMRSSSRDEVVEVLDALEAGSQIRDRDRPRGRVPFPLVSPERRNHLRQSGLRHEGECGKGHRGGDCRSLVPPVSAVLMLMNT
jgi:hypothetical protein